MISAKAVIVRDKMRLTISQTCRKVLFPLFLSGWMVSCSPLNPFSWAQTYLDIDKLNEVANQRTVNLQGIVVNVAPFLEGGAYQIQDKTGKVWVKTNGALPKKGDVISVKGEVAYEAIFIGPEKLGESYVIEITTPQPNETATSTNTKKPNTAATVTATPTPDETPPPINATKPNPETPITETVVTETVETKTTTPGSTAIEVVESAPETSPVESDVPASGAAALTQPPPATATKPSPAKAPTLPVANPQAPRPIANSTPTPTPSKSRPNLDDQFLPHKRLAK
jgi:hypothetical protein